MTTGGHRRIDRILEASYLDAPTEIPLARLREMRAECEEEEAVLSFERRLLHARLDILRAELDRRASGSPPESLIERLPEILADERSTSRGAFPKQVPPPLLDQPRRRVERLVSDDSLATVHELPEEKVGAIIASLEEAEREVSEARRAVQDVLDRLGAEVARRYKTGEADPADLLVGGQ